MEERDFVIIGTGPAGLSAAVTAAELGMNVTVIGEDLLIGGQIFRQVLPPLEPQTRHITAQNENLFKKLNNALAEAQNVDFLNKTLVWGIFDDKIISTDNKNHPLIKAKKLLIAEGAYETPVAFPGWTLPGVMSLGGAQILLKSQGVIPQGKTLIAGTGPLLLYTASQLVKNGAHVIGVLEASSFTQWMKWSLRLRRAPDLLWKGIQYLAVLKKHRIPVHYNHMIVSAEGGDSLEKITFAKTNNNWEPQTGTGKTLDIDTLCLNFGFTPSTTFSHMAGCEHECDSLLRGWVPKVNSKFETSKKGIFAAGDCTGIGGVKTAVLEGKIAATEAAAQLGVISKHKAHQSLSRLQKAVSRLHWYQGFLKEIYAFRFGLNQLLTSETIICRCEEIEFKSILKTMENGEINLDQIKRQTRVSMGRCQGRFCFPTLLGILLNKFSPAELQKEDFSARPPAKPLPLKEIVK